MGTREEKLRTGNLYHDPTINPGLGSPRCPRCLSLLNPNPHNGEWTITSVLHDATVVAGSGFCGMLSAIHGFNTGIPYVQKHVKGSKWLPFAIGLPPLLIFSAASSAFGGSGKLQGYGVYCYLGWWDRTSLPMGTSASKAAVTALCCSSSSMVMISLVMDTSQVFLLKISA